MGAVGWDGFVVQTPIPMERVEQGQGLELLALVVQNNFGWVAVPQMWEFSLCIVVSSMPKLEPAAVAQVVSRNLLLRTGTSFWHSPEFGCGKKD